MGSETRSWPRWLLRRAVAHTVVWVLLSGGLGLLIGLDEANVARTGERGTAVVLNDDGDVRVFDESGRRVRFDPGDEWMSTPFIWSTAAWRVGERVAVRHDELSIVPVSVESSQWIIGDTVAFALLGLLGVPVSVVVAVVRELAWRAALRRQAAEAECAAGVGCGAQASMAGNAETVIVPLRSWGATHRRPRLGISVAGIEIALPAILRDGPIWVPAAGTQIFILEGTPPEPLPPPPGCVDLSPEPEVYTIATRAPAERPNVVIVPRSPVMIPRLRVSGGGATDLVAGPSCGDGDGLGLGVADTALLRDALLRCGYHPGGWFEFSRSAPHDFVPEDEAPLFLRPGARHMATTTGIAAVTAVTAAAATLALAWAGRVSWLSREWAGTIGGAALALVASILLGKMLARLTPWLDRRQADRDARRRVRRNGSDR